MRTQHATVPLQSLGCGSTGRPVIERGLRELPGVIEAWVNPMTEMAYVEFDPAQCCEEDVSAAVRATGYGETRAPRSPAQVSVGPAGGNIPASRLALAGGLWLAAGFTLSAVGAALFPGVHRGYPLWALVLPGVGTLRWAMYSLGLAKAFALGFASAWLFAWIYNATPHLGGDHPPRAAHAANQPTVARPSREAL